LGIISLTTLKLELDTRQLFKYIDSVVHAQDTSSWGEGKESRIMVAAPVLTYVRRFMVPGLGIGHERMKALAPSVWNPHLARRGYDHNPPGFAWGINGIVPNPTPIGVLAVRRLSF
jgi:hypothetical protein